MENEKLEYNIEELLTDTEQLCDGLFLISCQDKQDTTILESMRVIAQKFNKIFSEIHEKRSG